MSNGSDRSNPPCVCQLYVAHRWLHISQLRPNTEIIRLQVPQKDPGQPTLITNIAKVQAPQGGRPHVPYRSHCLRLVARG